MKTKLLWTMLALSALPLMTVAQNRRDRSTDVNVDSNQAVASCGDIRIRYGRRPAITEETEMTIPASQVSTLQTQTSNSGTYVAGWDRNEYSVKTCKAVPDDDPNPTATLRAITTTNSNGRISVTGPSGGDWMANLIIMVPRLSSMNLQSGNGPLALRDLAGNIQVSTSNGPVSLNNVGGSVQVTASNGPISMKGASGDYRVTASNGPMSVALSGSRWDGPGLEATTRNGPMSVSIPDSYGSGVRIQTSDRSPVSCNASVCAGATRSLGSPSVIQIGSGEPVVRLTTNNGPLSIQSGRD